MAKATHKIVATVGKYTDRQTGEEKKRYLQCGVAFTDDQGRISLKIDAMPVTPDWSGFLSLYTLDDDRQASRQSQARAAAPKRREEPEGGEIIGNMEDDDLPF